MTAEATLETERGALVAEAWDAFDSARRRLAVQLLAAMWVLLMAVLGYRLQAAAPRGSGPPVHPVPVVRVEAGLQTPVEAGLQARLDTADVIDARERAEHLWNAIAALPEKLRLVVVLAGIEGHDMREVGALLEVPEGTVKSRMFLARKQLKERLSWMVTGTKG